jgi:hypothetical protein
MKNQTTKTLLLTCLCIVLIITTGNAQCPAGILTNDGIPMGKKVIITEISQTDGSYEDYKSWIGQTVEAYSNLYIEEGCWYNGEIMLGDADNFFVAVRLKGVKGEKYTETIPPVRKEEVVAASDFPVGSRVLVHNIPVTDKNSSMFYTDAPQEDRGDVIEADLVKNANGTYTGCILTGKSGEQYRTKKCFTECKVEKTVY